MNRAAHFLLVVMAIGLMAAPPARAETGSAASEIAALRREMRDLAIRNQQQIDGLQAQVRALSAALAKTRPAPETAAATALPTAPRPGADVPRPRMPMLPPEMTNLPAGCRFQPRCPFAESICERHPDLLGIAPRHSARCWVSQRQGALVDRSG